MLALMLLQEAVHLPRRHPLSVARVVALVLEALATAAARTRSA